MIPYGRQFIDEDDIQAVVDVLNSDWLTTGPAVDQFEVAFADYADVGHAVAVSSGTAALHTAMFAINVSPGDEVIVTPMTFAATVNCIVYQGGTPVFADVDPDTLLIQPDDVEKKITTKTKAVIGVDFAGHPCDWDALKSIAERHHLKLVADGCHALGALYKDQKVGRLADLTVFSFHPVKHITTGEGGMVTTDDLDLANRMRRFRSHGINSDFREREKKGAWFYEMTDLGFNYRITDIQCALGLSQLKKLPDNIRARQSIAARYDSSLQGYDEILPLRRMDHVSHAYHLYVIRVSERDQLFTLLREAGIGANIHYIPVHLHPYYRRRFKTEPGLCPNAEKAYDKIISLPLHPQLTRQEQAYIVNSVGQISMKGADTG